MIQLGSFVCDKEDTKHDWPAIVIYDHAVNGYPELASIKWMEDGHMSNRNKSELQELTPLEFCKSWCVNQMSYSGYDETVHP